MVFSNAENINIEILYLLWFPCGCGCVLPVACGGKREFYYSYLMGRTEKLPNVLDVQVASSLLKQSRKRIHLQRITSPVDLRNMFLCASY